MAIGSIEAPDVGDRFDIPNDDVTHAAPETRPLPAPHVGKTGDTIIATGADQARHGLAVVTSSRR